ncbi:hypothetical protein Emag_005877 [Eimeria magna]
MPSLKSPQPARIAYPDHLSCVPHHDAKNKASADSMLLHPRSCLCSPALREWPQTAALEAAALAAGAAAAMTATSESIYASEVIMDPALSIRLQEAIHVPLSEEGAGGPSTRTVEPLLQEQRESTSPNSRLPIRFRKTSSARNDPGLEASQVLDLALFRVSIHSIPDTEKKLPRETVENLPSPTPTEDPKPMAPFPCRGPQTFPSKVFVDSDEVELGVRRQKTAKIKKGN